MKACQDDFDNIEVPSIQLDMMVSKAINEGKRHLKIRRRVSMSASVALLGICILSNGPGVCKYTLCRLGF